VYLPGALSLPKLLGLMNLISLTGILCIWLKKEAEPDECAPVIGPTPILVAIMLLLVAVTLRFVRLGYAEFHEDEAEALMLGVRLFQGEDYALFLHRKGPAQMLLPVSVWLAAGYLHESVARFPFALSSVLSAGTIFLLGRRWFQPTAGLLAALFWLVNGYSIAFWPDGTISSAYLFSGTAGNLLSLPGLERAASSRPVLGRPLYGYQFFSPF
jgi:hypothetical protein